MTTTNTKNIWQRLTTLVQTGGAGPSRGGRNLHEREAGFTLIEMMIVVAIIGLIMGMVGLNVMRRFDEARVDTTNTQMRSLKMLLSDFKRVCGNYPTTEQGLDALAHKEAAPNCKNWTPFIENGKIPQDAWGHDFIYTASGDNYEIKSLGSDGKEGGEGTAKDLSSNDL